MTDMMNMAINDMELDNVTGGATRTVKNNSLKYANIREGAGLKSKVITKLNNGTKVKTTGNKIKKDGYSVKHICCFSDYTISHRV